MIIESIATLLMMPIIGKLSDKIDKFKLFTIASIWMIVMVLIYSNLTPVPFWVVIICNVGMMAGVMARMVPSIALVSALPKLHDRGAFMSINSSLQQLAGGIAAAIGGMIVVQKNNFSPIENYDILSYVVAFFVIFCIFMLWRVSKIVSKQ